MGLLNKKPQEQHRAARWPPFSVKTLWNATAEREREREREGEEQHGGSQCLRFLGVFAAQKPPELVLCAQRGWMVPGWRGSFRARGPFRELSLRECSLHPATLR